jgi:hypothetical protein
MQRIEEFQSAQNSKNGIIEKAILEELEKIWNSSNKIILRQR